MTKWHLFTLFYVLLTNNLFAQANSELQSEHFKQMTEIVKQRFILELKESSLKEEEISFAADTFYHNYLFRLKMRETSLCKKCVDENLFEMIYNYERLLEKYQNKLLTKLFPNDQIVLKKEIALWKAYYEGTQVVLQKLSSFDYIQENEVALSMNVNSRLKILEERLLYVSKNYFYLL